ncbi:hypothetical protein RB653_001889 [Dictyostelium firmibasis]|uniref:Iron-binding zinc finger CDGSH type domain-containing protein n=1 Tax=Dictyostelium firmibasis TaxID=79012 RepID=A0AAN7YV80_9MYCE
MEKEQKEECKDNNNNDTKENKDETTKEKISCCNKNNDGEKESSQCNECGLCKYIPDKIPLYAPYSIRGLVQGETYHYCTCGLTTGQQPLCDQKSCLSTKFTPIPFVLKKKQTIQLLCGCRYTGNPPFCDGIHSKVPFNPQYPPCICNNPKKEEICKRATDW